MHWQVSQKKSQSLLFVAVICGYTAFGGTLQILPHHLLKQFQASPQCIAMIICIASLGAALTRPFVGQWAASGLSNPLILAGSSLALLGGIAHRMAWSIPTLLGARLLLGAGEGVLFTSAITLVLSKYPKQHQGSVAGWFGLSMWVGLSLGPILLGQTECLYPNNSNILWNTIVMLLLLGVVTAYLAIWMIPTDDAIPTLTPSLLKEKQKSGYLEGLSCDALAPCCAFLLASYGYGCINASLLVMLYNNHLGGETLALPLFAISFLIIRIIGSPLLSLLQSRSVLLIILLIESIGLFLLSIPQLSYVLFGALLSGCSMSLLYPAFVSALLQRIHGDQQGRAIGVLTSCWDIGLLLAGIISGLMTAIRTYQSVFYVSALCSIGAFFIILTLKKDLQHDKKSTH